MNNPIKNIAKNTVWLFTAEIINKAVLFIISIYIARSLGPEQLGVYSLALSIGYFFTVTTDLGLNTFLIREIAKDKPRTNWYLNYILGIKLISSAISIILLYLLVDISGYNLKTKYVLYIFGIYCVLTSINLTLKNVFVGHENMRLDAITTIIEKSCLLILTILLLLRGFKIFAVGLAFNLSLIIIITISIIYLYHWGIKPFPRFKFNTQFKLALKGLPFIISNVITLIYLRSNIILLSVLLGNTEAGYYTSAYQLIEGAWSVPVLLMTVLFPVMSRYSKENIENFKVLLAKSFKLLLIIIIPIVSIGLFYTSEIITLIFGEQFLPAIVVLKILLVALLFIYLEKPFLCALICINKEKMILKISITIISLNLLLNLLFIKLWDYNGVALSTLICEIVTLLILIRHSKKEIMNLKVINKIARLMLLNLPLIAILILVNEINPVLAVILYLICYLSYLVIFRIITITDLMLVKQLIK